MFTFQDSIDTLMDFLGAENSEQARRDAIDAAIDSHRELVDVHQWSYLTKTYPLMLNGAYRTGTIEFDVYTNLVTLTGGEWPTWADLGNLLIDNIPYRIVARESQTVLRLSPHGAPVASIAPGKTYVLCRDAYPIPTDCVQIMSAYEQPSRNVLDYVPPLEWSNHRRLFPSPSQPRFFTVMADPALQGVTSIVFNPPPNIDERIELIYNRRLRELKVASYDVGTVSCDSNDYQVLGSTATRWTKKHKGCVIRFSTNGQKPTGVRGDNPYDTERIVADVIDYRTLMLDTPAPDEGYANVGYVISDPVDIHAPVMEAAFKWCLRKNMAAIRSRANSQEIRDSYFEQLRIAMGADSKFDAPSPAGSIAVPYIMGVAASDLSYYKS